jgi:hypothetical protein
MQKTYRLVVSAIVEAVQITPESLAWAAKWCRGAESVKLNEEHDKYEYAIAVPTIDGIKYARIGDYLYKNASGDFYIRGQKEFESKYHLVD